jgi:hypothetical protein
MPPEPLNDTHETAARLADGAEWLCRASKSRRHHREGIEIGTAR